jgi:molecular chaperone GrpE
MAERSDEQPGTPEPATTAGMPPTDGQSTPAELAEALAAERARSQQLLENWQRSQADYANLRRRTEAERAEMASFATAGLLKKLLEVVDDFDLALANLPDEAGVDRWVEGVGIIQRKLLRLLESEQVTAISALDQPFDPSLHEAVIRDESATAANHVVAELRKGYRLGDRVLRPTLVRVGDRPTSTTASN